MSISLKSITFYSVLLLLLVIINYIASKCLFLPLLLFTFEEEVCDTYNKRRNRRFCFQEVCEVLRSHTTFWKETLNPNKVMFAYNENSTGYL